MLVLTRRAKQSIRIGDDIKVTIVEVSGGTARVAIDAPRHITIDREEIYIAKKNGLKPKSKNRRNP